MSRSPGVKMRWFERAVTAIVVLLAAAFFVHECRWLEQPVIDDAAITLAYARTFFAGGGARLTFASARVEGFSDALWMVLVGGAFPLHLDPIRWAQRLSTSFGALTIVACACFGPAVHGRHLRFEDAAAPVLLCCFPLFPYWATSGMETTLYAFLVTGSVLVLVREERTGKGSWAGLWLSLLCLTRPEAPLVVAAAFLYWGFARGARRKRPGKQEIFLLLWLLLLCGGYLLLRWVYFARLVPNTYYAKRWWNYQAADYLRTFCQTYTAILVVIAGSVLVVSTFGAAHERRVLALLLLVAAGGMYFIVASKADWMNEFRFCAPYCGVLVLLFAAGVGVVRHQGGILRSLVAAALVIAAFTAVYRDSEPRFALIKEVKGLAAEWVRSSQGVTLDQLRVALGMEQGRYGIPDVGGSSLFLPHDAIVDVAGLADFAIAEHTLKRQAEEDYLLSEGLPDVLDAHGQSIFILEFKELMKHYGSYRDGSSYLLRDLTKDEDPRCPDGMAGVRDASARGARGADAHHAEQRRCPHGDRLVAVRPATPAGGEDARRSGAEGSRGARRGRRARRARRVEAAADVLAGDDPLRRERPPAPDDGAAARAAPRTQGASRPHAS